MEILGPKVLVTANFLYIPPDRKRILQVFTLQNEDKLPDLPWLLEFIDFWKRELHGRLCRVEWAWSRLDTYQIRRARFYGQLP